MNDTANGSSKMLSRNHIIPIRVAMCSGSKQNIVVFIRNLW
jgi:hypothetical protein